MPRNEDDKYVVTFGVYEKPIVTMRTWQANYHGENFAEIEKKALATLEENKDKDSFIFNIERW
jgi:hypothetical protein